MVVRKLLAVVGLILAAAPGQAAWAATPSPGTVVDRPVPTTGCGKRPPVPAGVATTRTVVSGGISDLLTQLQRGLCVDPARIYVSGKSNGGGFAGLLSGRLAGRIAVSAQVSGAFYPQGGVCEPSRPTPIIEFHGAADTTIPYGGNATKGLPPIADWLAGWAARNRCLAAPVTSTPVAGVTRSVWPRCAAAIEHYRIDELGHTWPSTTPNPDPATPTVIDATPLIWKFFRAHRLANCGAGFTH